MKDTDFFVQCRLPGSDASTADSVFFLNADNQFVGADASHFIIEPWVGSKQQEEVTEYISKEEYLERVEAAVDAIRSGVMQKVVLSRTVVTSIQHDQAERVYASLKESYPQAFVYWLRHPEHGEWLGATPELLLSKRANHFEVMSLAGTMPADAMENWSAELFKEQQIVTDDIVESLIDHGAQEIRTEGPVSHIAGPVQHLRSTIRFQSGEDALKWASILSPTPAVCGHPRAAALNWIRQHEVHDRGLYTGYLGVVYPNQDAQLFVNLRCMRWNKQTATLFVGGGIIAESNPEREWEETSWKSQALLAHIRRD